MHHIHQRVVPVILHRHTQRVALATSFRRTQLGAQVSFGHHRPHGGQHRTRQNLQLHTLLEAQDSSVRLPFESLESHRYPIPAHAPVFREQVHGKDRSTRQPRQGRHGKAGSG